MWKFLAGLVVGAAGTVIMNDLLEKPEEKTMTGTASERIEKTDAGTDSVWEEYAAV